MSITLTEAIGYFDEAEELSLSARTTAEKCRDYYDHKQWTSKDAETLRKRRQPVITRNRIKPKVDFLKGVELQTRTDPKASPRTPGDDNAATVATDAVRFVYDQTKFPKTKSDVFENLTIEGTGGAEVYCKPGKNGVDICIRRYHWDRLGWDPHSREKDFSDSRYRYAVAWMDYDQAAERYPEKTEVLSGTLSREGMMSTTYDDAPRIRWADARRKRIRVVKMEFLYQGEVWVCEFTRGGFLTEPEPSPYLDDAGVAEWSIILQSVHVDREGNRYGYVKAWLDTQDEINKRASKHLHLVSVRQTYSNAGATEDPQKLKSELGKPDGHLQFAKGEFGKDFGVVPTMDQAEAQFRLLQEAKQEIDAVGTHAALAGVESRDISGKAIGKLQQGSSTELKPLFEAILQFDNQVARAVWNRIRQFWTEEKWIRVTGDEDAPQWIGLNMPVTLGQQMADEYDGELPPHLARDPRMNSVVEVRNRIAEMDVDFTIEEVPDVVNAMQEQFEALTTIFPAVPEQMKPVAFEMLVEASTLRNKKKFLDKLRGDGSGSSDPQAAVQSMLAQMETRLTQAKIEEITARTEKIRQDASLSQAAKIVKMVEAVYSAMQAAGVAVSMEGAVPVADSILGSAGFQDQNEAPIIPMVPVAAPPQIAVRQNTSPALPAVPMSPAAGMMRGIETQRNDGIVQ